MATEYVERDGGYWITGARVSLDSVVYAFLRGASSETIAQSFPVLKLEEVFGAITYYLSRQAAVDSYLRQHDRDFESLRAHKRASPILVCTKTIEEARKIEEASQRLNP